MLRPAEEITHAFSNGCELPDPASIFSEYKQLVDAIVPDQEWKSYTCSVCTVGKGQKRQREENEKYRTFNGERVWNLHLASRRHKKTVAYFAKLNK